MFQRMLLCTLILSFTSGCALSSTEFHCKADAGLGCHRLDEVNAWVEQGIFDTNTKKLNETQHVTYLKR